MFDFQAVISHWEPPQWTHPDDLKPGDLIPVHDPEALICVRDKGPAFNPRFRPVVFSDRPGAGVDLDRQQDVWALRWRHHGERDMLGRDRTEVGYLAVVGGRPPA